MKVPFSWLKELVDIDVTAQELEEKLFSCGFEVEELIPLDAGISKVVVGKIVEMEKQEGTHLTKCVVDCGDYGHDIRISTGAANMKLGDCVPAALDGSTLPGGIKIKARKMQGVESNGMLCSGEELGLNDDLFPGSEVYGLLILPEDSVPGTDIAPVVGLDDMFGEDTWEKAESSMQKEACQLALGKAHLTAGAIRYLFGGDLLRQGVATSLGVEQLQIPMFGLYGACSTSGEALALASMCVAAGYGERMLVVTSSHFGSAEKEFRFPLSYANQRPLSAQWTVTGSGAFIVGKNRSHVRITGVTVGKIVDYGLKDSQNMGACMAPAACDTIIRNLEDFERKEEDYDRIITGDLGYVGQSILFDLMREKEYDIKERHMDCGMTIFDQSRQDTHAGGSGCGCAAATLSAYILPAIASGEWKRVLFVPTGALMSTVSYNEGASVPGIAHGIVLEHC